MFLSADQSTQMSMCMTALDEVLDRHGLADKVCVAGSMPEEQTLYTERRNTVMSATTDPYFRELSLERLEELDEIDRLDNLDQLLDSTTNGAIKTTRDHGGDNDYVREVDGLDYFKTIRQLKDKE